MSRMLVLVGLPGSGKSTFSKALEQYYPVSLLKDCGFRFIGGAGAYTELIGCVGMETGEPG
ncbi:hypothetical protein BCR43DRAFT_499550 [Syncephalastrum racemosum]|uniref:P-loop containing nucleoside triphosphate hydrolase protein n=1 Tax=Syncephalastrum racemosum TaxID=13706 RepID=A0A1X2H0J2_SYNRA|nr:hypothetical protein BCR43DRAFT_499550 [Syncephalastrum racemosum]